MSGIVEQQSEYSEIDRENLNWFKGSLRIVRKIPDHLIILFRKEVDQLLLSYVHNYPRDSQVFKTRKGKKRIYENADDSSTDDEDEVKVDKNKRNSNASSKAKRMKKNIVIEVDDDDVEIVKEKVKRPDHSVMLPIKEEKLKVEPSDQFIKSERMQAPPPVRYYDPHMHTPSNTPYSTHPVQYRDVDPSRLTYSRSGPQRQDYYQHIPNTRMQPGSSLNNPMPSNVDFYNPSSYPHHSNQQPYTYGPREPHQSRFDDRPVYSNFVEDRNYPSTSGYNASQTLVNSNVNHRVITTAQDHNARTPSTFQVTHQQVMAQVHSAQSPITFPVAHQQDNTYHQNHNDVHPNQYIINPGHGNQQGVEQYNIPQHQNYYPRHPQEAATPPRTYNNLGNSVQPEDANAIVPAGNDKQSNGFQE